MKRRSRTIAVLLVLTSWAGACSKAKVDEPPPPAARASAAAPWVRVREPRGVSLLELPAHVLTSPQSAGAVAPPYPARVNRIYVQAGERVERGSPMFDVVMPQISGAAGQYVAAHTRLEAYTERKRQLEVLRAEGLARVAEISEVAMRLAEARADQQSALAVLRSAGVTPTDVARILDSGGAVTLRSPVAGVVTEMNAVLGETRESSGKPLGRVVGEAPARIEARVSHRLPAGAKFEFVSQAGDVFPVKLIAQAAMVDPRDGTVPSWFEPAEPRRLPGGLSGKLRTQMAEGSGAVVVPSHAVGVRAGHSFVLVRRHDRSERVEITVLASSGADALVQGNLTIGDEIAAEAPSGGEPADGSEGS